jgi:uncharacterized membrane protein
MDETPERSTFGRLPSYFLRGAVITLPVVLTVWIAWEAVTWVDSWLGIPIPGLGLVVVLAGITLVGLLATNVVTRAALGTLDEIFVRLPLLRLLYTAAKDLMNAFAGDKRGFTSAVRVRIDPDKDIWILGFITAEDVSQLGLSGHVAVYLPQSYNFAGQLILVPTSQVQRIDTAGTELMKFIVSGGVAGKES